MGQWHKLDQTYDEFSCAVLNLLALLPRVLIQHTGTQIYLHVALLFQKQQATIKLGIHTHHPNCIELNN